MSKNDNDFMKTRNTGSGLDTLLEGYLGIDTLPAMPPPADQARTNFLSQKRMQAKMEERPGNFQAFNTALTEPAKKLQERLQPKTPEDLAKELKKL